MNMEERLSKLNDIITGHPNANVRQNASFYDLRLRNGKSHPDGGVLTESSTEDLMEEHAKELLSIARSSNYFPDARIRSIAEAVELALDEQTRMKKSIDVRAGIYAACGFMGGLLFCTAILTGLSLS